MIMGQQQAKGTRPDGWWYPYIFVGGFVVVLVVNMALLYFATSTFNGLESRHAYEEGLHYNDRIAQEEAQKALGWTVGFDVASAPAPEGRAGRMATLSLSVTDRDGNPVSGLTVETEIRRPVVAGMDHALSLLPSDRGRYSGSVELQLPGKWEVRLVAVRGDASYRLTEFIFLR